MRAMVTLAALVTEVPFLALGQPNSAVQHQTLTANGIKLHYVVSGAGEPVVLVPGWPESWYAWRRVMPLLVKDGRRVFVIDPSGFGDSEMPATGYDPETIAKDLHGFIETLGLSKNGGVDIVAHDVGTWISFHHATRFPQDVRRLVLTEASIPGVSSLPSGATDDATNLRTWHFAFNRLDELPEMLVKGHEREYLTWFFAHKTLNKDAFDQAAVDEYVRLFSRPGAAKASFDYYRIGFSEKGVAQAKESSARRLTMPVLALGGGAASVARC